MLVVEGDRSFYLFSGSRREEKGQPKRYASYALQMAMMRHARACGRDDVHDLWGIAPEDAAPDHPWYGVGLFKKGFGGRAVVWAGTWDIVVDRTLYRMRAMAESWRATVRGTGRALAPAGPMSRPRSMPLGQLTDEIGPERVIGLPVGEVRGLAYDSRAVEPGTLFFAIPGVHVDGHDYAARRRSPTARWRWLSSASSRAWTSRSWWSTRSRDALADAADAWYDHPSRRLHVIGITGTDGKTTTAFLAEAMLRAAGWRPGLVGTVEVGIGDERSPNENRNTTPEALELQALLADMVAAGNDSVVMEATSHGLAQARTRNVAFDVGILTNLTSEHLEFHGSWENYRSAKAMLFQQVPISILNVDDPSVAYFHAVAGGPGRDLRAGGRGRSPRVGGRRPRQRHVLHGHDRRLERSGGPAAAGQLQRAQRLGGDGAGQGRGHRPRPGRARTGCGARRARPHGDRGPGPAVRRGGRLRAYRRLAGQGAAHPAPAWPAGA